jgi:queuine tRNA-ribosyltransferase
MLGPVLVSVHNVRFYQRLMADIRRSLAEGTFGQFRANDPRSRMGPSDAQETLKEPT